MKDFDLSVNGLRAVAVLVVIAFHFGLYPIRGGFVGVDIFFVISGFVITASIMERLNNKSFTLIGYFKSRFYRIFPALLVTTLITLVLSAFILFPVDAERSAWHGLAAIGFVSNFLFWKEVGYFDADSSYKPFLHTWSLAVEWQFYMLWPLAVYILYLFRRFATVLLIFGIGLGIAASGLLMNYPNFVFYMMPPRGWEFALGGLIALVPADHKIRQRFAFTSFVLGFGAIAISVVMFNDNTVFPGFAAALPCFGAFLLLFFKRDYSEKVLSLSPFQYLGKVSYSLYLVHWPVLILYQHFVFRSLGVIDIVLMSAVTLILSHLSYVYVEQEFRKPAENFRSKRVFVLLVLIALSGFVAWFTISTEGKTGRYGPQENALIDYFRSAHSAYKEKYGVFFPKDKSEVWDKEEHIGIPCLYDGHTLSSPQDDRIAGCIVNNAKQQGGKTARVVVIGDSNGKNTFEALSQAFPDIGFSMLMHSGCAAATSRNCFPHLKDQLAYILDNAEIDGVVLSSRYSNQPIQGMRHTVVYLVNKNVPVLIIGATPTLLRAPDMMMLKKGVPLGIKEFKLPLNDSYYYGDIQSKDLEFQEMANGNNLVYFFDKKSFLCPDDQCIIKDPYYQTPIFLDSNHLSEDGIEMYKSALSENKEVEEFFQQ